MKFDFINKITKNKHFNNFKGFIIGGVIAILLGYIANFLINRNLSKEDMGLFSYYYNLFGLLVTVFSINVYSTYLRFNTGKFNLEQLKKNVRLISVSATVVLGILIFIITRNVLISTYSFLILFNERTYFFRSEKKIRQMNGIKYLSSSVLIVGLLYFVKFKELTFDKALLCYGFGYIISVIVGWFIERKNKNCVFINYDDKESISLNKLLKYSIPVTLTTIVSWFSHVSDQVIMKQFLSLTELGTYAISYRIIVVIQIFTSLFLMYYPMLYFEEADNNNYSLINKIRNSFIFILLLITVVLIFSREYVYILLGATQYLEFTNIFIYLVIVEFIRIVSGLFLSFRSYTLQTTYALFAILIPTICQLVLNIVFIPKFGVYFAAFTQVASALIYLLITIFIAIIPERKHFKYG